MSGLSDIVEMYADGDEERNLLHHVRGNCHLSTKCRLCKAEGEAFANRLRIESLVNGTALPDWVTQQHPLPSDKPKATRPSLQDAVNAFHDVIPRNTFYWGQARYNTPRLRVIRWIRDQPATPNADDIAQRWTDERDAYEENGR